MVTGDQRSFAIGSAINQAYEQVSLRALGLFVIHIGGYRYGVYENEATMLASSFDEVCVRITRRGMHTAPFATEPDAGRVADAIRYALYAPDQENERFFGIPQSEFHDMIYAHHIIWAPDGDAAFDDGSYVLHFDVGDQVRLIGFKCDQGYQHDPQTLRSIWLESDRFYSVLEEWSTTFETEWAVATKMLS